MGDSYKVGLTLRFPRVERIREDLCWKDVMTDKQIKEMQKNASGKLVTKHWDHQGDQVSLMNSQLM